MKQQFRMIKSILCFTLGVILLLALIACAAEDISRDTTTLSTEPCVHPQWQTVAYKDSTCEQGGYSNKECTQCGQILALDFLPNGHWYKDGVCEVCGAIEFCDHPDAKIMDKQDATSEECGSIQYFCEQCSQFFREELPTQESTATSIDQIYDTYGYIEYTCDLSVFPTEDIRIWFGEIILVEEGKLLVSPGYEGKEEFGEIVWLVCEDTYAYSIGQVVTYTFCDVKAPDREGEPLSIIALSVYMEE